MWTEQEVPLFPGTGRDGRVDGRGVGVFSPQLPHGPGDAIPRSPTVSPALLLQPSLDYKTSLPFLLKDKEQLSTGL